MAFSTHAKVNNGNTYHLNILNDNVFRLKGNPVEGNQPGRTPTLAISVDNNQLILQCMLNNGKPYKEGGGLRLDLDLPTAQMFIVMLEDAVRRKEPGFQAIRIMKTAWDRQNNKPGEPYPEAVLAIGKDQDGLEVINIKPRKGPSLSFHFSEQAMYPVINIQTGEAASPQQVSRLACRGFIKWLEFLVPYIAAGSWDYTRTAEGKWDAKKARQQQNGGGNNYGNNNYGNNNQNYNNNNYNNNNNGGYNNNQPQQQAAPAQQQQAFDPDNAFDEVPF